MKQMFIFIKIGNFYVASLSLSSAGFNCERISLFFSPWNVYLQQMCLFAAHKLGECLFKNRSSWSINSHASPHVASLRLSKQRCFSLSAAATKYSETFYSKTIADKKLFSLEKFCFLKTFVTQKGQKTSESFHYAANNR